MGSQKEDFIGSWLEKQFGEVCKDHVKNGHRNNSAVDGTQNNNKK